MCIKNNLFLLLSLMFFACNGQEKVKSQQMSIPKEVQLLLKYYPQIIDFKDNKLLFKDGSSLIYDDGKPNKSFQELLDNPAVKDQFLQKYTKGKIPTSIAQNFDPGRIRNESFFRKIYGTTENEVRKNLREIIWCPKTIKQKIKVTTINGIDKKFEQISAELDNLPEFKKYITDIGGTFTWRKISGTNRLSLHSFGMTVDINIKQSHYWQWDCKCTTENVKLSYKNKIPQKLVDIFEKHGFIWGGKWYHYDTMHFEYRPELLE